jgi:hypothetical protein
VVSSMKSVLIPTKKSWMKDWWIERKWI